MTAHLTSVHAAMMVSAFGEMLSDTLRLDESSRTNVGSGARRGDPENMSPDAERLCCIVKLRTGKHFKCGPPSCASALAQL